MLFLVDRGEVLEHATPHATGAEVLLDLLGTLGVRRAGLQREQQRRRAERAVRAEQA
jgi:hypothetical protein